MERLNGDAGILFAKFNQDDPAVRSQGIAYVLHHGCRIGEFMIDVDHQNQIDGVDG